MEKSPDAFRTISEVAQEIGLPQHVLRFWETRFTQIKPLKRGGGRRYYRPDDIDLLKAIRVLLYNEGYTIRGVQRLLKEQGAKSVAGLARGQILSDPVADGSDFDERRFDAGSADPAPAAFDEAKTSETPGIERLSPVHDPAFARNRERLLGSLQSALAELAECARLLDGVRTE